MARDDVPTQAVVRAQGFFEVDGPGLVEPAVRASDSAEMSMAKRRAVASICVAVMQAPLSAILSPRPTSSR